MTIRLLCCSGSLDGGGSERQLWQLACHIQRPDFAPEVYLQYRRGTFLQQLPPSTPIHSFWAQTDHESQSTHTLGMRLPGGIYRAQVKHLAEILQQRKIDLVYDRTFHMTLVTSAACRLAKVPRASVIVSPPSHDFAESRERFRAIKRRKLSRAYTAYGSVAIAVSSAVADDAASFYGIDRDRISVVPSAVDVQAIRDAAGNSENSWKHRRSVCVVGRLSSEKGQSQAIAAFRQLTAQNSDYTLDFIGDGPDRLELERQVAEFGLNECVRFHGFRENPYPFIRSAAVLLVPSLYEGLPNVALEAMVLRTPVIATRCSNVIVDLLGGRESSEAVEYAPRGSLVAVNNPSAIARSLEEVLVGMQEAERIRQLDAAESWVLDHHALPVWLDRMQDIFRKLLRSSSMRKRGSE